MEAIAKPKEENDSWYGFNSENINKRFQGGLTYCGTFCILDEYNPVAVYHVASPDREKGHKDYLLLMSNGEKGIVRGMDTNEIEPWRYQKGIKCNNCGDILYSRMRHDYRKCGCGDSIVDGGRDYLKMGGPAIPVTIDLLA